MASGINIYSQLLISLIRIVDISNSNCWYQQLNTDISNASQFQLLISTIRISDISNLISAIRIADISNSNCWYQQFELLISAIVNMHFPGICKQNVESSVIQILKVCVQLLISAIRIVDINNSNYYDNELLISVIRITDINNWNCWYQQFELLISAFCVNCWYHSLTH